MTSGNSVKISNLIILLKTARDVDFKCDMKFLMRIASFIFQIFNENRYRCPTFDTMTAIARFSECAAT